MQKYEKFNDILKQALSSSVEPGEELNQKILNRYKENNNMKVVFKRKTVAVFIAAAITLAMSATALAAWQLLNPKQVAEHFGDQKLSKAFEAKGAVEINKSIIEDGYSITLLGITSGKDLSDLTSSVQDIHPERTYAVVSIAKEDGSKMPHTSDEGYGNPPFFVSPLIKGQKPWQVNIASMNGGYQECVVDGVMYRLIECDGIEIFADRGLYLCVSTTSFFDINAYKFDEKTGEITPKPDFVGVNVLFDLPLDIKKADHEKAEKYLKELLEPSADSTKKAISGSEEKTHIIEKGIIIPESIKEVTYDETGNVYYEYGGKKVSFSIEQLFDKDQVGESLNMSIGEVDDKLSAIQFSRDADGVITGKVILIDK